MPGTERSLEVFDALVETSVIGGRAGIGRLREHLVLPLDVLKVHIVMPSGVEEWVRCSSSAVRVRAVRVRGVRTWGVRTWGVPVRCTPPGSS